jgi:Cft2 family RNA processing exonuclease
MTFTRLTRDIEIGANCYALEFAGRRLVLDCGLHPQVDGREGTPLLEHLAPGSVDAAILSHAHHDHLGCLPLLQRSHPQALIFMSEATRQLADVMLHNSVNVMMRRREEGSGEAPLFSHGEVNVASKRWVSAPLETRFDLTGERLGPHGEAAVSIEFFDAGHILGSVGVRIGAEGRTVFYTGDVQFDDQTISKAARFPTDSVDVLIMETTRGDRAAVPGVTRASEQERLATAIREVFDAGGAVLIPTFALGKTQELLAMIRELRRHGHLRRDFPIYISGLGAKLTEIHDRLAAQTRRRDPGMRLSDEVPHYVLAGQSAGSEPLKPRRVYALSSGMMTEHTLSNIYAQRMLENPKNGIFFVGYCDPETPGGILRYSESGDLIHLAADAPAHARNCRLERFDFSGHATRENLRAYALRVRPKKILLVHGDAEASGWFRETLSADLPDCEVLIPAPGETIDL